MPVNQWRYTREEISDLSELDEKLAHRGNLGWELVTILHSKEAEPAGEDNILKPPKWTLLFKQAA